MVVLALAGIGFALGYAVAPRHDHASSPPARASETARASHKPLVAIPAPAPAAALPALAVATAHHGAAAKPSTSGGPAALQTSGGAVSATRSVTRTRQTTKTQSTTTHPSTGTTTDPFNGQSHQQPSDSSTGTDAPTTP